MILITEKFEGIHSYLAFQVLQFNAHEVYEILRTKRDNLSPHKSNAVALGRTQIHLSN